MGVSKVSIPGASLLYNIQGLGLPEEILLAVFELSIHTAPNLQSLTFDVDPSLDDNPTEVDGLCVRTDRRYPDNALRSGVTTHATNSFTPVTLSHVCRYWRALSFATPELWSRIYVTKGATETHKILQIYLKNSGTMPLDLVFRDSKEETLRHGRRIIQMIELASTESPRWRTLKIRFRHTRLGSVSEIGAIITRNTTPNLEALGFSFNVWDPANFKGQWVKVIQNSPRLNEIQMWATMDHAPDFLAALPHRRLTTLTLPMVAFTSNRGLIATLPSCTNLTSLSISLDPRYQRGHALSEPTSNDIVLLPHLRRLYLVELDGRSLPTLVPYFRLPALATLSIHLRAGPPADSTCRALENMLVRSECNLRSFTFLEEDSNGDAGDKLVKILESRALESVMNLTIGSLVGSSLLENFITRKSRRPPARKEEETGDTTVKGLILPKLQTLEIGYLMPGAATPLVELIASRTSVATSSPSSVTRLAFVNVGFMDQEDLDNAKRMWDDCGVEAKGPVERIFRFSGSSSQARLLREEVMFNDFSMMHGWVW